MIDNLKNLVIRHEIFLRNITFVSIGNFLKMLLGFVLIPIYIAYLKPSELGRFDLILSFIPIIDQFIYRGLLSSISKFYCKDNDSAYISFVRNEIRKNTAIVTLLVLTAYILTYGYSKDLISLDLLILTLIILVLENLNAIQLVIYNITENFKSNTTVSTFGVLIRYVSIIILVITLENKLHALFLGAILANIYVFIKSKTDTRSYFEHENRLSSTQIKELFNYSTPLIFLGLSGFFYFSLDRVILATFTSLSEVGILGISQRIGSILAVVLTGISTVLGIKIFQLKDTTRLLEINNKYILFLFFFGLFAISFMFIFESLLMNYIFVGDYSRSFLPTALVITILYWNKTRESLEYYFLVNNKTALITKIFIIFTLLNLILSILLVQTLGVFGVLIGSNIAFVLHAICLLIFLFREEFKPRLGILFLALILNIFLIFFMSDISIN